MRANYFLVQDSDQCRHVLMNKVHKMLISTIWSTVNFWGTFSSTQFVEKSKLYTGHLVSLTLKFRKHDMLRTHSEFLWPYFCGIFQLDEGGECGITLQLMVGRRCQNRTCLELLEDSVQWSAVASTFFNIRVLIELCLLVNCSCVSTSKRDPFRYI